MDSHEFLELKSLILDLRETVNLIVPKISSVSYITEVTGKSRQTVTQYLKSNFLENRDFWLKNGKIMITQDTTIKLLRKYNGK